MAARKKSTPKSGTLIDMARVVSVDRNRSGPKRIKASPQRAEKRLMRLRAWIGAALVFVVIGLIPAFASAVTVTLNPASFIDTEAADLGLDTESTSPSSIPYLANDLATDGGSTSITNVSLSHTGFEITFDHTRAATLDALASSEGEIFFTVDATVDYAITGTYSANDSDGRQTTQYVALQRVAGGGPYFSFQESHATPNQSFTLGNEDGDFFNYVTGSATGTLAAGDLYRLIFFNGIQASPAAASGVATASGSLSFMLVPEPSTALLLGFGLVGLAARRRRRAL